MLKKNIGKFFRKKRMVLNETLFQLFSFALHSLFIVRLCQQ